jgi:hypothetical protein
MMNIYNGNITTDSTGEATVYLPSYFDVLNRDFRYQLTVIGSFAQAIVKHEISNNLFVIATDRPHVKVSWQVTGVRQDPYAEAHRTPVEQDKSDIDRGRFLHPESHVPASALPNAKPPIGSIPSMIKLGNANASEEES